MSTNQPAINTDNLGELFQCLSLPNAYLQKLFDFLEDLAKEAIDDSDLHSGRRLLSLVICIQELREKQLALKKDQEKQSDTSSSSKPKPTTSKETKAPDYRPRYTQIGYDQSAKLMRDAIINLVKQKLINLNQDISTRSFYSIIERHHLSNIEASKLDNLTLPMSQSRQDRPRWKEAVTQALFLLINEGYLTKPGRYTYCWTDLAKNDLCSKQLNLDLDGEESTEAAPTPAPTPTPTPLMETEEPLTKEELPLSKEDNVLGFPQPFAAFTSKPRVYSPNGSTVAAGKRDIQ